jgi:threonine dehydratase
MPENASSVKVDAVRSLGAEVRFFSHDSGQTEIYARSFANERGLTFVSPYNDPAIIGGQGTIGKELVEQIGRIDELFLSVGGGGLLSGVAGYLKGTGKDVRVSACSPRTDHAMYASVHAGRVVVFDAEPTIADGCAGGMEDDAITLPLVARLVDKWYLLSEEDTRAAMRLYIENDNHLLEGSAGLAIAALLQASESDPGRFKDKNVVVVICGSRISLKTLKSLL